MNPSKLAVFLARFGELLAVVGLVVVLGALDPGHLDDLLKPTFTDATSSITQGNALHGGHGIAFADVNGDGRVDIFVSNLLSLEQSTLPDELYLNQGNFVFTEESAARGISAAEGEAHAAVFVDVNGDGFVDLFKGDTNGTNELYLNDGRGYFTLTAAAGMKSTINPGSNHGTRGVGAGDFNGDGHIDLFAANSGQANELYLNRGDGTLVEEAVLRGVADEDGNGAQTQGCAIADFDGDGDLDIFLAKRFGPNRLYRNDGHAFFTEVAVAAGVAMATIDCDGGVFGDIDNDGDLDLVVAKTSTEPHGVFRNRGDGTFADESAVHPLSNERAYNILLEDLDLDGDLDLVIIFNARNAHRTYFNDGTGHFEEVKALGYEVPGRDVRCGAFADLNGDGSRDLVVVDRNTFNLLFENQGMPASGRHWLAVDVKGPQGQPSMPGAWVEIYPAGQAGVPGQRLRVAHVGGTGEGYCRADHNVAYFGLPSGTYDVQARLPSGEVVRATGVGVDRTITLDPTPPAPLVHGRFPVGQTAPVGIFHPADRLRVYVLLASFRPGAIALGPTDRRVIPLTPDRLFFASTRNLGNSPPFQRFVGQLDAQGIGVAGLAVPDLPGLAGLSVEFAFVTLDPTFPSGSATVSRSSRMELVGP